MKLRNKKTGDTVEGHVMVGVQNNEKFPNPIEYHTYISLAELNEEWEEYEPVEPIIEDPKDRKVFKEWADLFGAKRFRVDHLYDSCRTIITGKDDITDPAIELPGIIGKDSESYTILELCGDEEECES